MTAFLNLMLNSTLKYEAKQLCNNEMLMYCSSSVGYESIEVVRSYNSTHFGTRWSCLWASYAGRFNPRERSPASIVQAILSKPEPVRAPC
jgi:hypothetical protein